MGRLGRSMELVRQSYQILVHDKELIVLPLISGTVIVGVAASFFAGFGLQPTDLSGRRPEALIPLFLMYVVVYSVGIFFQAAVVAGATERLRGGDPSIRSALGAATRRIGPIVLWAVAAATVGVLLRKVQEQTGFIGKIVVGLVGAAWSLATFFVVPVLVLEDLSLRDSIRRSLSVFKETWGEAVAANVTIGVVAALAWVTLVAVVGLAAWAGAGIIAALAIFALGAVSLMVFFSTLQGIYLAALYRYATAGPGGFASGHGFDGELLASTFMPGGPWSSYRRITR